MPTLSVKHDQEQIERAVEQVEREFADKVQRIRYSVGKDWANDPAIFFRILIRDGVLDNIGSRELLRRQLLAISYLITDALKSDLQIDTVQPYFSFRLVSEQEALCDAEWD